MINACPQFISTKAFPAPVFYALLFATLPLTGCSNSFSIHAYIPSSVLADLPSPVSTSAAQYRAYGDSITAGATLAGSQKPYPAFVAEYEMVTYADNAIAGDQACDVPTRQIFPNEDFPTLATRPTYTLLIGTNDVTIKGPGAYESVFKLCHRAAISWLAIPAEYKVLANGNGVTTTGAGAIDSSNHWNAWATGELGSTVSFTITTSQYGPIYAWPLIIDGNPGTYTYSLDGLVVGSASTETTPNIATENGSSSSLGFLRLPPVAAGTHVVTFTQTSAGENGVYVVGIGTPAKRIGDIFPTVLAGTIPYQEPGSDCNSPDGPCQNYIDDIEADVDLFSADGLNVRLFDTRKYMFGTPAEMNNSVHPNEFGQYELSHAVEASW
jgi:hypothetical protein